MRDREPALLHRLREIVDLVTAEFGIPVVANGDCFGTKDRERICALTGESLPLPDLVSLCLSTLTIRIHRRNEHHDCTGSRGEPIVFPADV